MLVQIGADIIVDEALVTKSQNVTPKKVVCHLLELGKQQHLAKRDYILLIVYDRGRPGTSAL